MTISGERQAPAAAVETPAPARRFPPVRIWAWIGVAFLAVQAWTWVSYLASGPGSITFFRDTTAPSWKWGLVMQTGQVALLAVTLYAVGRDARRRGEMTFNLLFLGACASLVWLDPMLNYFRPGFYYSSNLVNVESWVPHIPGQIAPYANLTPQPLIWEVATYVGVFLPFVLLLTRVWAAFARRFPAAPTPGLFGGTLAVALALDLILELPMLRTGLFAYPAATHRFAIWGGETYQFPLAENLGASLFWVSCAALVVAGRRGLTPVERGAETITCPRRRTLARFLAITGFAHVVFLAFPMGIAQVGPFYTDEFPAGYTADLHNGWCGDDGQPYGPCPAPGVPWQARTGGVPDPGQVYRSFPYFAQAR